MSATPAATTTTTTTTLTAHQCLPIQATTMGRHLLLPLYPWHIQHAQPPPHWAATTSSTCVATTHHHVWLRTLFVRSAKFCRKIKIQRPFYLTHLGPIWRQRTRRASRRDGVKKSGKTTTWLHYTIKTGAGWGSGWAGASSPAQGLFRLGKNQSSGTKVIDRSDLHTHILDGTCAWALQLLRPIIRIQSN